jgi:hypothetical protein
VEVPKDNFVAIGWGGYPEYSVNSENDIEYVIKLVKYVLEEGEASSPSKDYSRYKFVDNEYGKSRLVLAVIKEYLNKYNSTYQQLKGVFPDKVQGSRDVFRAVKDIKEKDFNRYFMKSDEKLKTSDNIEIAVCTQWGKFNIYKFVETVNSLDISKIEY